MMVSSPVCRLSCDLAQIHGLPKQETPTVLHLMGTVLLVFLPEGQECFWVPKKLNPKTSCHLFLHEMIQPSFNLFGTNS